MRAEKYSETATLYAREPLRFSGVPVAPGEPIPDRPDRQRRVLFRNRKVTHRAPAKSFATGGSFSVPQTSSDPVAFTATPGERVTVTTPAERKRRRS